MTSIISDFSDGEISLYEIISDLRLNNLDGILKSKLNAKDLIFMDKL